VVVVGFGGNVVRTLAGMGMVRLRWAVVAGRSIAGLTANGAGPDGTPVGLGRAEAVRRGVTDSCLSGREAPAGLVGRPVAAVAGGAAVVTAGVE